MTVTVCCTWLMLSRPCGCRTSRGLFELARTAREVPELVVQRDAKYKALVVKCLPKAYTASVLRPCFVPAL